MFNSSDMRVFGSITAIDNEVVKLVAADAVCSVDVRDSCRRRLFRNTYTRDDHCRVQYITLFISVAFAFYSKSVCVNLVYDQ